MREVSVEEYDDRGDRAWHQVCEMFWRGEVPLEQVEALWRPGRVMPMPRRVEATPTTSGVPDWPGLAEWVATGELPPGHVIPRDPLRERRRRQQADTLRHEQALASRQPFPAQDAHTLPPEEEQ